MPDSVQSMAPKPLELHLPQSLNSKECHRCGNLKDDHERPKCSKRVLMKNVSAVKETAYLTSENLCALIYQDDYNR
jgi:hypothetical protein